MAFQSLFVVVLWLVYVFLNRQDRYLIQNLAQKSMSDELWELFKEAFKKDYDSTKAHFSVLYEQKLAVGDDDYDE